jgi:hypothetical protein
MVYFTQLIYIKPGQESVFEEFEAVAMPLISRYNGQLLLRVRPDVLAKVDGSEDLPYEIHLVGFGAESDFEAFSHDPARASFLPLKEASVERIVLIKGVAL